MADKTDREIMYELGFKNMTSKINAISPIWRRIWFITAEKKKLKAILDSNANHNPLLVDDLIRGQYDALLEKDA